jgi:hypothetical protein
MPIPTVDETVNMTIDEKIRPQTLTAPPTFDISVPVVPGHDMVINHLDGTQELGTGNEALAVASQEAESGQHVPLSAVQPQPVESVHRSVSDPEVNGPDQVALKAEVAAAQAANAAPAAPPATEEPETPVEPEVPVCRSGNSSSYRASKSTGDCACGWPEYT